MATTRATAPALDSLIRSLGTMHDTLVTYRHALVDPRPTHGTQHAVLLALMGETVLPVMPTDLVAFAAARGVLLERRSVASALLVLRQRGAVASVGRGRWRRVGPPV